MSTEITEAELIAFGQHLRDLAPPMAKPALDGFCNDILAGIELANPGRVAPHDIALALRMIGMATSLLFRAGYANCGSGRQAAVAADYIIALAKGKVDQEMMQSVLYLVEKGAKP